MLNKILQWSFMPMSYFLFYIWIINLFDKRNYILFILFFTHETDHQKPKNNKIKYRYKKQKQIVIKNKLKNDFLN